jgi:NAD-dependent deacetylase
MSLPDKLDQARDLLANARQAVALTGAGVSTRSGIPDFRSPSSGVWNTVDHMEVASIYTFRRRPQVFYDWIRPVARLIKDAVPNPAHLALAQLEAAGVLQGIITQNVDNLHTRAGSRNVYEVHGHFREVTCLRCYTLFPAEDHWDAFMDTGEVPHCPSCGGVLKPNAILYGEQLPVTVMNEAQRLVNRSDVMLVAGSSLEVAPAGDLPAAAVRSGARLIIVNFEPTYLDFMADVVINADVVDVLPELASQLVNCD